MENQIDISIIAKHTAVLFDKYKVEHLPKDVFTKYTYGYPIPKKLSFDQEKIQKKLKLIYWAVVSIQIELGNMLIAIESYNKFKQSQDVNNAELAYLLFIHHYFLTIECIYRVWERISRVLNLIHTKKAKRNCYYHKTIAQLESSKIYPLALIVELNSHLAEWEKISNARNKYSHEYSRLTHGIDYDVRVSPIKNAQGQPIYKIEETRPTLESMFNLAKERYDYLKKLDSTLINYINHFNDTT